MLLGGAVAGQGAIDIYLLIAIAWFAAWLGDTTSFFIGRRLGREFVIAPRAARRDQPRALREGRGLLLPPRRQDDLHRPLHQPGPRLRPLHRRQLRHALPRLRPLQHPRHRALGQRPHPRRLLLLAQHRDRRQVRRQRRLPARHPDRRRRRLGLPLPPLPRRREPRAPRCAGWRATRPPAGWSRSAAATGRSCAFLWDRVTPGGTFGLEFTSLMAVLAVSLFVLVAYVVLVGREPGPTPGDVTAMERGRTPPRRLVHRLLQGLHLPRLRRLHLGPDRRLRGAPRRPPPLGRVRGPAGGDDADLDRHPRDQGRGRPAAARRRRWSTTPAPRSRAATPPTRSSTSGWR